MGARAGIPEHTRQTPQPPPLRPYPPESPLHHHVSRREARGKKQAVQRVAVVVLGDVGRSPRMQYHAMSLSAHGVRVDVVGYTGERCIMALESSSRVAFHRFDPPLSRSWGKRLKKTAYVLFALVKALALMGRLLYELIVTLPRPDAILVQNPPSLPGLTCVWLACCVRGCTMVLDWHNLGFTMFERSPRHPLVWVTRKAEGFFGRHAGINLTVSVAMRDWILEHFGVREAHVVHDKPPVMFRPPTLAERHDLFKKLLDTAQEFSDAALAHTTATSLLADSTAINNSNANTETVMRLLRGSHRGSSIHSRETGAVAESALGGAGAPGDGDGRAATSRLRGNGDDRGPEVEQNRQAGRFQDTGSALDIVVDEYERRHRTRGERTPFTAKSADGVYALRRDRPALLVSSTSWTPDEDFSVLLEALVRLDSRAASGAAPTLPFVVVVVTGKGPEKARYVEKMRAARMSRVALCTAWLEPEDYPLLLGSADLGISLHTSTSGVDLPMKVVDMFGCGVPVCAAHFDCLHELVREGYNGCVFKDSTQLALQLEALLEGFPRAGCELEGYRSNVRNVKRWEESWDQHAWPLFATLGEKSSPFANQRRGSENPGGSVIGSGGPTGRVVAKGVGPHEQRTPSKNVMLGIAVVMIVMAGAIRWYLGGIDESSPRGAVQDAGKGKTFLDWWW